MKWFLTLFALLVCTTSYAKTFTGTATFTAQGNPGLITIAGTGVPVTGDTVTGTFVAQLSGIKTGINLRDTHLKDKYLEVKKFPTAELMIAPPAQPGPWSGVLTLKGVARPVLGTATFDGKHLKAEFTIDVSQYPGIGVPSWLGVTVAKDIAVTVEGDYK